MWFALQHLTSLFLLLSVWGEYTLKTPHSVSQLLLQLYRSCPFSNPGWPCDALSSTELGYIYMHLCEHLLS